jgi:hypothetical protein
MSNVPGDGLRIRQAIAIAAIVEEIIGAEDLKTSFASSRDCGLHPREVRKLCIWIADEAEARCAKNVTPRKMAAQSCA